MVVAVHTAQSVGMHETQQFIIPYVSRLIDCGSRGVQLFYILSAFTLFSSSYRRFQKDVYPKLSFYVRRAFRILPLWWLSCIVYGIIGSKGIATIVSSGLFIFGFIRYDIANEIVPGGWSLFVEETFYILLPLIFYKITSFKKSIIFLISLVVLSVIWRLLAHFLYFPKSNDYVIFFPFNQWFCFGFGIIIYYLLKDKSWIAFSHNIKMMRLLDISSIVLLLCLVTAKQFYFATAALAFFVVMASSGKTISGKLNRNLLLMRFGTYCYSIYLLHFIIISSFKPVFSMLHEINFELRFLISFSLVSLSCLVCGHLSFNFFEKPSVNFGKKVILRFQNRTTNSESPVIL